MHHQRTITELIYTAKALQTKAAHAQGKVEQFHISLGLTLAELKERKPTGVTWPAFVKKHFDYSRERADELIRIGSGSTTVEASRERKRASMKKSRKDPVPRGTGKLPIATSTSAQRSAAKKLTNGDLMKQASKLAAELSDFVNNWTIKTEKFWEENREALEAEAGADDPNATSRGLIFMYIETYASNLWGLGQALDGR